jgi:glutathione S-transferase
MSRPRLITIPISHYCEKARWAMDRAAIEYDEERHLQVIHIIYARRAGGGLTVPVLVLSDGTVLDDSSKILRWVDDQVPEEQKLYPADLASRARAIEVWLDRTLGPDGRAWMYSYMLHEPELTQSFGLDGTPEFEQRMFDKLFKPVGRVIRMRVAMHGASTDVSRVQDVYDEIAARLEDGRPYLLGERFTAADLAFAALSAAVIVPHNYGVELPAVERLPAGMREQVEQFREHPAGRFALRMFDQERLVTAATAVS